MQGCLKQWPCSLPAGVKEKIFITLAEYGKADFIGGGWGWEAGNGIGTTAMKSAVEERDWTQL